MMLYLYLECAVSVPERDVEFLSDTLVLEPGKIKSFAVTSTDLGLSYLKTNTGCNKVQWNYMHNTKHDYVGQEVATHLDIVYEMISSKKRIPQNKWVRNLQERLEKAHTIVIKLMNDEMV